MTGAHLQTVYSWIATGTIKSGRLGRKILVDKLALERQLEESPDNAAGTGPRTTRPAAGIRGGRTGHAR